MIDKKILLAIAAISVLYTGCNEEESSSTPVVKEEKVVKDTPVVVKEKVSEPLKEVKQKEVVAAPAVPKIVQKTVQVMDGVALYKKCASCHGINAEKKALNKSAVIKDWDASKIASALKGYKEGTYGGTMKGIMKSQVATFSDKDITIISEHIASFK